MAIGPLVLFVSGFIMNMLMRFLNKVVGSYVRKAVLFSDDKSLFSSCMIVSIYLLCFRWSTSLVLH